MGERGWELCGLAVIAMALVLLAPGTSLANDALPPRESAAPSADRVVLESWKRPLLEALFLHAGGAYQIQARRVRGVIDRRQAAQVSVSPFGLVLRW